MHVRVHVTIHDLIPLLLSGCPYGLYYGVLSCSLWEGVCQCIVDVDSTQAVGQKSMLLPLSLSLFPLSLPPFLLPPFLAPSLSPSPPLSRYVHMQRSSPTSQPSPLTSSTSLQAQDGKGRSPGMGERNGEREIQKREEQKEMGNGGRGKDECFQC